jgi:CheY-like chemotaxis protein
VPEVDGDQLAALRRLRAAFGPIEIIAVTSNDPTNEARMADTRRMTPEEQGEAHALLVKAVSDPDWQAARAALDDLMSKLLVVHRLLEAEERLAKREPPADPT